MQGSPRVPTHSVSPQSPHLPAHPRASGKMQSYGEAMTRMPNVKREARVPFQVGWARWGQASHRYTFLTERVVEYPSTSLWSQSRGRWSRPRVPYFSEERRVPWVEYDSGVQCSGMSWGPADTPVVGSPRDGPMGAPNVPTLAPGVFDPGVFRVALGDMFSMRLTGLLSV